MNKNNNEFKYIEMFRDYSATSLAWVQAFRTICSTLAASGCTKTCGAVNAPADGSRSAPFASLSSTYNSKAYLLQQQQKKKDSFSSRSLKNLKSIYSVETKRIKDFQKTFLAKCRIYGKFS